VADEREAVTGDDARPTGAPARVVVSALLADPAVVGCLGRLQSERRLVCDPRQPVHHVVGPVGRDGVQHRATADGHEEKDTPEHSSEIGDQIPDRGQFLDRASTDCRVDLERDAGVSGGLGGRKRRFETAVLTAERIVGGGVAAVDAERHPFETGVGQFLDGLAVEVLGPARRERDKQALVGAVLDQFNQVGPFHRVAAREHDQLALVEAGGLVE
jgi:hypothetical protein